MKSIIGLLFLALSMSVAMETMVPLFQSGEIIQDSYIIVFRPEVSFGTVQEMARDYAAKHTYQIGSFKAFGGKFSEEAVSKLRTFSDKIKYIEKDQVMRTQEMSSSSSPFLAFSSQQNATWGLDRVDQVQKPLDSVYNYYSTAGSGVDVYIIDTGVLKSHEEFQGRAIDGYDFHNDKQDATDDNGHGTHVGSTVGGKQFGLAKRATIIGVKTLGRFGAGSLLNVAKGVEFAAQKHASTPGKKSVANMSLGGGVTQALDDAVAQAIELGLIVVIASGNSDADACNTSPARVPTGITVNAANINDTRASFSNWGACTHIFAPGQDITGAWITADNSYRTISGTSMACPHTAGAVAVMLGEKGGMTPADAKKNLVSLGSKDLLADVKGSPNVLLYSPYQ